MSRNKLALALAFLSAIGLSACERNMRFQPKLKYYRAFSFFEDGRSERPPVPGTIARGQLRDDELLYTGKINGKVADEFPFPVTKEVLERGHERFDIYCSVCHDRVGRGQGMIVRRGYSPPPSYHTDRLRKAPVGHFFDVMTNGFGQMPRYAPQVPVKDRWAIAAYIRALQLSENARLSDVPQDERQKLEAQK